MATSKINNAYNQILGDWVICEPGTWTSMSFDAQYAPAWYIATVDCQTNARFYTCTQIINNMIYCKVFNMESVNIACRMIGAYK